MILLTIILISWLMFKLGKIRGKRLARFSLNQIKENLKGGEKL